MEARWDWDTAAGTKLWLRPGEHIFWRGQPDPHKIFGKGDLFLVPFSLMWGGFAIFWEIGVTKTGWGFGTVWGIPFVLIGLYFIFGRFFYKRWSRRGTRYCISGQRILVSKKAGQNVQAIPLAEPLQVTRNRSGKSGTLTWQIPGWQPPRRSSFGSVGSWSRTSPIYAAMSESGWPGAAQSYGMLSFADIADVAEAMKQLEIARTTQAAG